MDNHSDRPARTRTIYSTIELCLNKKAGPYGSLELIISNPSHEQPQFFYWPLNIGGNLHGDQITDLCAVIGRETSETVWTRVNVQDEIPGLLST